MNVEGHEECVIAPKRKNEGGLVDGQSEEERKRIAREKRNAYHRARRARLKKEKEDAEVKLGIAKQSKPRYMYFSIRPDYMATQDDMLKFRRKLAEICKECHVHGKETIQSRYATELKDQDYCHVEYK